MKGQVICKLNEAIQQRMLFQQENEEEEEEEEEEEQGRRRRRVSAFITSHPASSVRNRSPSPKQIHRTI